ncbi:MAG TPA: hypothetical protein VGM03_20515 [Phycisphaerae bacterium]
MADRDNPQVSAAETEPVPQVAPAPPRRHWGRRILATVGVLLVLVAALVGFAPAIASSRAGSQFILGRVNGGLAGRVQLDRLAVSWRGPTQLDGLSVIDPAGRQALRIDEIRAEGGAWQLLTDLMRFGDVSLNAPRAVLYLDAKNEISLAQALRPRKATPPKPQGPFPELRGRVVIKNGSIKVINVDGGVTELSDLNGEVALQTLSGLRGNLAGVLSDEGPLQLEWDANVDPQKHAVTLGKCRLVSPPFSAEVGGSIANYDSECVLALKGHYDAAWKSLTDRLHALLPATVSYVEIQGRSTSDFSITGPAHQRGAQPPFRGVVASTNIGWDAAKLYGVPLGPAKLAPALRDGVLAIPSASIPASDGKVNLGGVIDFSQADPLLSIKGKLPLLERVPLTKEVGESLLSYVNPVFLKVTRLDGRISLGLQDVSLPMSAAIKTRGAGQGRLDLSQVRIQPTGLLAELLALGGIAEGQESAMEMRPLDFRVQDGRILYDDLTMSFSQGFDLKFSGSVGFDDSLDLAVSLPVGPELLKRLGAHGPAAELAQKLTGTRVTIPIVGTRQEPKLDLSKVNTTELLKGAAGELPTGKAVEGLLNGLKRNKD